MAAPPLSNTFESGQSNNTTIDGTNSAVGGNAFNAITGTPHYSTTQVKNGTLSMGVDTTASVEQHVDWTGLGSITTSVWFRAYCYFTAVPGGAQALRLSGVRTNAPANSTFLSIDITGKVQALLPAQTGIAASLGATTVATNQWIRIEWRVVSSTTAGEFEWWLYNTADAALGAHTETKAVTGQVFGANTDQVRFGQATVSGPTAYSFWMEDIAVSSSGQIGPSTTPTIHPENVAWLHT